MKIGKFEVTMQPSLTWGGLQEVQTILTSGAKIGNNGINGYNAQAMLDAKYKLLELCIKRIEDDNDAEVPFSREWMNALSIGEGDTLYEACDAIAKKKIAVQTLQLAGDMPADPIVVMEMLSAEYGWTPAQIREQAQEDIEAYVQIILAKRSLQKYGHSRT